MDIREELKKGRLILDGSMGTMLQTRGLAPGELPERWNITHPEEIIRIHQAYFEAGSNIVCTNTFGANCLKYGEDELKAIIGAAVRNARQAAVQARAGQNKFVALDVGPLGRLLKPYGDLDFEEAVRCFGETIRIGAACGVDLIFIETMNDSYETKAAVLAARENTGLPVFASNAYGEDGKLMTGASPAAMTALLEGLGVDALGANCSLGPEQLTGVVQELLAYASVPVLVKPNAGLPEERDGRTVYGVGAEDFAVQMRKMAEAGASLLGGCCGTTPDYIRKTVEAVRDVPWKPAEAKDRTLVSSYTRCVEIGSRPVLIGERINPTGKKRFKQALREGDTEYILQEALTQQEAGAHILDVNVGLPEVDEKAVLAHTVFELQGVTDLPLQIDTSDPAAMERALRIYNGKAMINSVNGKEESMRTVFPLVKKYGGTVVALTLDEAGIPSTAEGRIAIAEKILKRAAEYGIASRDVVFDPLCMAVSAEPACAQVTLDTLRCLAKTMKRKTVLGVSNVSFGLPRREAVNAGFLTMALENGLSAAIINPCSAEMMKSYHTYLLLHNMDENCESYIRFVQSLPAAEAPAAKGPGLEGKKEAADDSTGLPRAIEKGLREQASQLAAELLQSQPPLQVVNDQIIPALDRVGRGFEKKTVYLPQLLMSAEAAKAAFEQVKKAIAASGETQRKRAKFVLATVKGDIHDIGKNIVKVLLENYGFQVIDLGRDVPPETVAETVVREGAPFCGLSALMTTTVPAMEETIRLLRQVAPVCRIVVGGAVMNAEYARRIGADKYAADAMETVRYAEEMESA